MLACGTTTDVCGAWSNLKKWSEYKCIEQLPDSAQSEYFILSEVPNTPRLVISRVWKTGSTALAQVLYFLKLCCSPMKFFLIFNLCMQVFKCLYGRVFLQYASLHKHRGPFIDSVTDHMPFKHAILVRNPLDRFISGYTEILARLTFGPRPGETFVEAVKAYGMIDFKSVGGHVSQEVISTLRAAPGWPRIGHANFSEYEWLWEGQPQDPDQDWDEEKRFRAFIAAVECGEPFLWWAHVASASWFVSGPRHVLTKQEAMEAKKAGAPSPWRAAVMSPPLELHHVVRHESFAEDLIVLLQLQSNDRPNPLKEGGVCHDVISKPHNSGNEGSLKRSHLPRSPYYTQVFERDPTLLCSLVRGPLLQDYVCFDYAIPVPCQQ